MLQTLTATMNCDFAFSYFAMRVCLKCGNQFPSEGPGNRICRDCTQINARLGHIPEVILARQRGVKRHNGIVISSSPDFLAM